MNKARLHHLISSGYAVGRTLLVLVRHVAGKSNPSRLVVIVYHGIEDGDTQGFIRQMAFVRQRANVVDLQKRPLELAPGLNVGITFDDALASSFRNGIDLLISERVPVLVFVATGSLGVPPSWVTDPTHPASRDRVLSGDEIRTFAGRGVGFGSHSVSHPMLTRLSDERLREELTASRIEVESLTSGAVNSLAFPYGDFDDRVLRFCRDAGYETVYSSTPEPGTIRDGGALLTRVNVSANEDMRAFELKITGAYEWQGTAVRLKRRLRQHSRRPGRS